MTVIPKSCKHPAAALKLVEYLGSRPAQTLLMEGEKTKVGFVPFRVPVRTDLEALPIFKKHPEFLPFMRGFATPSIEMPIPEWMRVRDEIYKAKLNKAILGLATPAEVLAEIQRAGDLILSE
jgi:ABC-type glycerol-3-phosphate transport system substrate-binding protein